LGKENKVQKVLFVCLGNIVRSPLAEGLFHHYVSTLEISAVLTADSAGTSAWHVGERPDQRMAKVAAQHGIHYDHRARQINFHDLDKYDLLIAMDEDNLREIRAMVTKDEQNRKMHLLREWDDNATKNLNVPDPYYDNKEGFLEVFYLVDRSVRELVKSLGNAGT